MLTTADIKSRIQEIYKLEQLSGGTSAVHRRHPSVKLVSAFVFIVLVVSFDRTEFGRLVPFIFYPVVLMALSGTPWPIVLKRVALALPFALLAGISNVIFDRAAALTLAGIAISAGVVSFFSILFKTFLCVTAVLLLVAVTPFSQLTGQLRRMHVPDIFVTLFEMIYRYIGVLLEEASSMYTAYMLRSTEHKGLQMRHMGSFVGQLLIRSFDRAERVYAAMKCRGYPGGAL
ncbi:MAG: cobalt ECF transporter T component CbiQ, partial [Clostridiales bacterium]|nr:cobalt ECF transporter T component CbiQ [Clostridiales bacterium]